jgi:hypothetical protein
MRTISRHSCRRKRQHHGTYHTALISRSGTEQPIEDSGTPIRDREGRLTGVLVVFHDIIEKRRAGKAVCDSDRLAMTGRMAATLSGGGLSSRVRSRKRVHGTICLKGSVDAKPNRDYDRLCCLDPPPPRAAAHRNASRLTTRNRPIRRNTR